MNMLSALPHDRLQWARQLALLLTLALAACAGKDAGDLYAGRAARPDNQAVISSIQGKEMVWSGKDLAIHYMVLPDAAGTMDINGFVEFEYNLGKYDLINQFRVYIHFIDAQGIILETRLLWNVAANADATLVRWTFQRQWPLPPGAQAIGFSYMGTLSGIGSTEKGVGSGAGWSVKELP